MTGKEAQTLITWIVYLAFSIGGYCFAWLDGTRGDWSLTGVPLDVAFILFTSWMASKESDKLTEYHNQRLLIDDDDA